MGKLAANFFISLDGVVQDPHEWHFPYFDDAMGAAVERGQESAGAFLLGRRLYDEWSEYWPAQPDDAPFAAFINGVRKYVVSDSLTEATWTNTTVVSGDIAAQVRAIKDDTDGDVAMSGCATTVRWLLEHDLLDELNLLVHPIAVGHGQRLFEDTPTHPLQLVRHEVFDTGVLDLTYAPAR